MHSCISESQTVNTAISIAQTLPFGYLPQPLRPKPQRLRAERLYINLAFPIRLFLHLPSIMKPDFLKNKSDLLPFRQVTFVFLLLFYIPIPDSSASLQIHC